jgi:hypothetical protein
MEATMSRAIAVLALAALTMSVARADIPPPKGVKRVVLDNKIETEKEYPDLAFFIVTDKVTAVKLTPKAPLVISGAAAGGRFKTTLLYAVPKDAAEGYKTVQAFHKAIIDENVPGLLPAGIVFMGTVDVKANDPRRVVVENWRLEKIDAKEGMIVEQVKKEKDKKPANAPEEESEEVSTAFAPRGGVWIAGLAGSLAVVFAGLWFRGRTRRT